MSVFFTSTCLRIRVCKRVELEAHPSVHHLALFQPRRWMFMCSFRGPMFWGTRSFRPCLGIEFSAALAHFCVFLLSFSFSVRGPSTEMTFLSTCTNIRCVTCVSMRLDFPGHFVLWFHGTCSLTLSPTSYSGRARSSIEKKKLGQKLVRDKLGEELTELEPVTLFRWHGAPHSEVVSGRLLQVAC